MKKFPLDVEQANAYYDDETRIAFIAYHGRLTSDVTVQVYDWLDQLYKEVGIDTVYGQVFDFRKVTEFEQSNLQAARKTSNRMNMKLDTSHIPVALIVGDFYQEEILRTAMRIPVEHLRKRVVWSEEDAIAFLNEWHSGEKEQLQ